MIIELWLCKFVLGGSMQAKEHDLRSKYVIQYHFLLELVINNMNEWCERVSCCYLSLFISSYGRTQESHQQEVLCWEIESSRNFLLSLRQRYQTPSYILSKKWPHALMALTFVQAVSLLFGSVHEHGKACNESIKHRCTIGSAEDSLQKILPLTTGTLLESDDGLHHMYEYMIWT